MFDESPQRQTPDSLMLPGFWYRALPSGRLRRGQLQKVMLLEIPLVVGRDAEGKGFALQDACPPRHAAFLRTLRRQAAGMQLPRLALRRALRTMPTDPLADPGPEAQNRSHLRGQLCLPGMGRLRLGLHSRAWSGGYRLQQTRGPG